MKRFWTALGLTLCLILPGLAYAERSADFSDMEAPALVIPYQPIDYSVRKEGYVTFQTTKVAESFDKVTKYFLKNLGTKNKIGEYYLVGFTLNAQTHEYNGILALSNEHYYFTVKPNGTGTAIDFETTPRSYISGRYVLSTYGYRLPDGSVLPADEKGEDGL